MKRSNLEFHFMQQAVFPTPDKNLWLAYLVLKEKYPNLTYWSIDGYSCDALADYSINLVWYMDNVIDWTTKRVLFVSPKSIWECTTSEICNVWMRMNGETEKTKRDWMKALHKESM